MGKLKIGKWRQILVGCVYRSSSGTDNNNENLIKLLEEINQANYSHVLIMGDFNFEKNDWNTWSTPSNESCIDFKFIERVRDNYYYQHVTKPTRARIDHEPHILDLLLTNEEGMLSDLEYYSPLGKSDHSLLKFNFHCYIQQENIDRVKYYYYKANFFSNERRLISYKLER